MPGKTIKNRFLQLPIPQKIVGIGAVLAIISAVLPWYQDIDAFNTGDKFLGITGPLYLIGYIVIALGLFSLILTGFYYLNKKLPSLPMKESMIYILSGATSLFLLVIANSVYFHTKFGINITSKESGIGMMIAFVGAIAILVGGILQHRESGTSRFIKEFEEETRTEEKEEIIDPVLELNNFQKEQKEEIAKEIIEEPAKEPIKSVAQERFEGHKGVREYKTKSSLTTESKPTSARQEPYPDITLLKKEAAAATTPATPTSKDADNDKINPNSVIRMDL